MVHTQQTVDSHGHSGYAVVLMAPQDVQNIIEGVRSQLDISFHMIPAHATVKGTFIELPGLEEILNSIASVAQDTRPLVMEVDEPAEWGREGSRTYVYRIKSSPELDEVHRRLFNAINPITTNVYGREAAEGFHFHMTIYQEVDEANNQKGLALAANLELPPRMEASNMCLMGRVGPRGPGGVWHVVKEFPLTG